MVMALRAKKNYRIYREIKIMQSIPIKWVANFREFYWILFFFLFYTVNENAFDTTCSAWLLTRKQFSRGT